MFVGIEHDTQNQILIITVREDKVVQLIYTNLPPGWELDAPSYEGFVVDYLNGLIEERYDRKDYWRNKEVKASDPEYDAAHLTSERMWFDAATDEIVFMECKVISAEWNSDMAQFIITIKNTLPDRERV
jgi:hypothetical protein